MTYKKRRYKKKQSSLSNIFTFFLLLYLTYRTRNKIFISIGVIMVGALSIQMLFMYIKSYSKKIKYIKSGIQQIDKMTGIEFEEMLAVHFKKQGYKVKTTTASNDYGADLVIENNSERICVQAKRYNSSKISNKAIQEVVGSLSYYKATRGMVVTNSYFTKNAVILAQANNVELWDRNSLINNFQLNAKG